MNQTPEIKTHASDEEMQVMYDKLRSWTDATREPHPTERLKDKLPVDRWTPTEFQVASGYAIRVAKNTNFDEFKHFIQTGELTVPIKMTPAEMEFLMGGSRVTDWLKATGWIGGAAIGAAGAAACIEA
jgi:hypothetical protein